MSELHLNKIHSYDNKVRDMLAGEGQEMIYMKINERLGRYNSKCEG